MKPSNISKEISVKWFVYRSILEFGTVIKMYFLVSLDQHVLVVRRIGRSVVVFPHTIYAFRQLRNIFYDYVKSIKKILS